MHFSYFISRNRFELNSWLGAMGITSFEELLTFCKENSVIPPEEVPDVLSHTKPQEKKQVKDLSDAGKSPSKKKLDPKARPQTGDQSMSQNLADHGVYVDSTEAMKGTATPKRKIRKPMSRSRNAKKS